MMKRQNRQSEELEQMGEERRTLQERKRNYMNRKRRKHPLFVLLRRIFFALGVLLLLISLYMILPVKRPRFFSSIVFVRLYILLGILLAGLYLFISFFGYIKRMREIQDKEERKRIILSEAVSALLLSVVVTIVILIFRPHDSLKMILIIAPLWGLGMFLGEGFRRM